MTDKTQRYNEHAESIAMKLGALSDWLKWETGGRDVSKVDWADVGDLAHVDELLSQVCQAAGIEEEEEA